MFFQSIINFQVLIIQKGFTCKQIQITSYSSGGKFALDVLPVAFSSNTARILGMKSGSTFILKPNNRTS